MLCYALYKVYREIFITFFEIDDCDSHNRSVRSNLRIYGLMMKGVKKVGTVEKNGNTR